MKRVFCMLLALLLTALCLPGCQPTPTEEIVVNKGDGTLENAIFAAAAPVATPDEGEDGADTEAPLLREVLGAPEHWSEPSVTRTVPLDSLTVTVDAAVTIPAVSRAPVYTVRLSGTDAAVQQKYLDLLLGDLPRYEAQYDALKRDFLRMIEEKRQVLESLDPAAYGERYETLAQALEQEIERLLEYYAEAPEDYVLTPWRGSLGDEGFDLMSCDETGAYCWLNVTPSFVEFSRSGHSELNWRATEPLVPETAEALAAQATVQTLLDTLGLSQFQPESYTPGLDPATSTLPSGHGQATRGYQFTMAPCYGGLPVYERATRNGSDTALQAALDEETLNELYAPFVEQEELTVLVDDGQVSYLSYQNPMTIVRTENENVALLPFEQVQERFWEQIFQNYYVDEGYPLELRITDVELSLMRVRKADDQREYYLLPVWDFYGYDLTPGDDPAQYRTAAYYAQHPDELAVNIDWWSGQSMLTLNAIDGSVINRNVGY